MWRSAPLTASLNVYLAATSGYRTIFPGLTSIKNSLILNPMFRYLTLFMCYALPVAVFAGEPEQHFLEKVKPLLDSRCVSCHGPDKVKGGLRMDSREALVKGGDSGPALAPGKPSDSLIIQAVLHSKKDLEMPPKEKLTPKDVAVLQQWIAEGAPWPETTTAAVSHPMTAGEKLGDAWSDPRNPIVKIFGGQRLDLWSLRPIKRPVPPSVRNASRVKNPIDRFILAKVEEAGLKTAPEANRPALARRLYFDLTGLPPTPEEMAEFLKDKQPGAFERLVDKLLESPRYGEHWARQWLDVIRYSDSNGFDWDEYRKNAWRFRDYTIGAFNDDKPFNQFILEQLAGDELIEGPPRSAREQELLVATGYLRLGPQDNSAPLFNEQARSRAELMADLVETTGSAFLGLTMSCCRCHDHKFDPLSQADHFRMRAFFEGVKLADDLPLDLAHEQEELRKHNARVDEKLKPLQEERDSISNKVKEAIRAERLAKISDDERAILDVPSDKRTEMQKKQSDELEKKIAPSDKEIIAALTEDQKKRHDDLGKQLAEIKKEKRDFTRGLLMTDAEGEPPVTKILFQGDYKSERDPVQPGFISVLNPNPARISKGKNPNTLGRRLTFAQWIASPENPLTARVLVNRVWQSHFGRGLVETPNDFGLAGARPSHPELLDWLASEFIRGGWSVKNMHRLIVTSATYRQASSHVPKQSVTLKKIGLRKRPENPDSENRLLARQNLRRLTAEQLRDSLLAVSGKLRSYAGGPPIWPELPSEILVANPAFLDDNAEKTKGWYPSPADQQGVRSIYMIQKRTVRVPFLETFDLPENATSCARRTQSTVAPQAFSLLNSPLAIDAAKAFAARIESEADTESRIQRAFLFAFQREPDSMELSECSELVRERGWVEFCRALLNVNEFIYID